MTEPPRIRISDEDRERYADRLRTAFGEGRITDIELEDRLRRVYEARFDSDLVAVTTDLPVPTSPAVSRPISPDRRNVTRIARLVAQWYFPALICTAIWAITSFGGYFWPIWVFFGLTIPFVSSLIFADDDDSEANKRGELETGD